MNDSVMLFEALHILKGRCYGFGSGEGTVIPFSKKILSRFQGAGCLYLIQKGVLTLRNGYESREFSSVEQVYLLLPGGWHTPRLMNRSFVEQVREARCFSLLTPYEIARIHELHGLTHYGLWARTPETYQVGHTGVRLQVNVVLGQGGQLHFEKENEGVASPQIGVMLGLRRVLMS